jgi:hypothetical protein
MTKANSAHIYAIHVFQVYENIPCVLDKKIIDEINDNMHTHTHFILYKMKNKV